MNGADERVFRFGQREVAVVWRSITQLDRRVDAIVSSDDNYLSHGGGVSAAIWTAAGAALEREVGQRRPRLRLGDVFVTGAGKLQAVKLIHAVTIDFDQNRTLDGAGVERLARDVIDAAGEAGCTSLALPLLASGSARLNVRNVANAIARAAEAWLKLPSRVHSIVVSAPGAGWQPAVDEFAHIDQSSFAFEDAWGRFASTWRTTAGVGSWIGTPPDVGGQGNALLMAHLFERLLAEVAGGSSKQDGQKKPDAASEQNRKRTAGAMLRDLKSASGETGAKFDSNVLRTLESAVLARNRLAHAGPLTRAAERESVDAIAAGVRTLLDIAGPELRAGWKTPGGADAIREWVRLGPVTPSRAPRPEPTPVSSRRWWPFRHSLTKRPRKAESAPAGTETGEGVGSAPPGRGDARPWQPRDAAAPQELATYDGTTHVRKLHQLLREQLPSDVLASIDARLVAQGYTGNPDMRLLEFCVRDGDLAGFIAGEFGRLALSKLVRDVCGDEPAATATALDLAQRLLSAFGFPETPRLTGLRTVRDRLQRARAIVATADANTAKGQVRDFADLLEYVFQVFIRFLSQVAYGAPPERVLRESGKLRQDQTLEKCGLGKLLGFAEFLAAGIEERRAPNAVSFEMDFGDRPIFPREKGTMLAVRNAFSHYQDDGPRTDEELLAAARKFLEDAQAFLDYLANPGTRVFPRVIQVSEVRFDKCARKTVVAQSDEGTQELIFTDAQLQPGEIYFMHPLTNPLRVDPILVPAGSLTGPRAD